MPGDLTSCGCSTRFVAERTAVGDAIYEAAYRPYRLRHRFDDKTVAELVRDYRRGLPTTELTGKYQLSKPVF